MKDPLPRWIALAALTLTVLGPQRLDASDGFLPAEKAFAYLAEADGDGLTVYWNVAPGYYLYKAKLNVQSATPGIALGAPIFPPSERHQDEYFGEQEVFRDDFALKIPLQRQSGSTSQLKLRIQWQGCADAGLCYPPTTWEASVALPALQ